MTLLDLLALAAAAGAVWSLLRDPDLPYPFGIRRQVPGHAPWHLGWDWDCGGIAYVQAHGFGLIASLMWRRYDSD